jgi:chromosomal replication initiation ATPase DnaA
MIGNQNYQMPDGDVRDCLLAELSDLFARNGSNIRDFNLPRKTSGSTSYSANRLIEEELSYEIPGLSDQSIFLSSLNSDQLVAFNYIVDKVTNQQPGFFFVSGYGGTGKTYLWNCIVTHLRAQKRIVLTVASSGLLLCYYLVGVQPIRASKYTL